VSRAAAILNPFVRRSLRVAAAVAPEQVDRQIVRFWSTPRRARRAARTNNGATPWTIASGDYRIMIYSQGFGPTVLLAHGWSGSAHDMAAIGDELRGRGFRVVAFDMPAHGKSSGRRTTLPAMARAIRDVAHAIGPVRAVVGHSLGAAAALLALRDGLAADCAVAIAPPREAPHFLAQLVDALGLPAQRLQGAIRVVERQVGPLAHLEADRAASALRLPGLVIHDVNDRQVPFAHGAAIARAWRGAELVSLEQVGHRRILEHDVVIQRVAAFVETNVRRMGEAWPHTP
jgi:pimeloyl-ACP methyl ester carboxylesterase